MTAARHQPRRWTVPVRTVFTLAVVAATGVARAGADEGSPPAVPFVERVQALPSGDHAAAVALGYDALDAERYDVAEMLFRRVLSRDPGHDLAYQGIWEVDARRPLLRDSEALRRARGTVPDTFRTFETRHYVILSDSDPVWIRTQGRRLERAHDRFFQFVRSLDLRPLPPRHKLVAVVFEELDEFRPYAANDGNPIGDRIAGYYSLPNDRLVFYHVESQQNVAAARAQLEALRTQINALHRASRRAGSTGNRGEARELRRDVERKLRSHDARQSALDEFALTQSVSVTVHEAVHQLMFHTRVQSPFVDQPLWLTEGLATAFETDSVGTTFGPFQDHEPRRRAFYRLIDDERVIPLRALVMLDDETFARNPGPVYDQSYALTTWLCRNRKLATRAYMMALRRHPPGRITPEQHLELFEEAFGDIDQMDRVWRRAEGVE